MNKKPFHEVVAEKLITQLKQGTAPWQRPWKPGQPGAFIPMNPITGKRYKGINAIQLMAEGHSDPRWMTYKQAETLGAQVRRGEKGTMIQYWKFSEEKIKTDEQGDPVLNADGKPVKVDMRLERPRVFYAVVFNAGQIDGLPARVQQEVPWNAIERAEQMLKNSSAVIHFGEHNRAFYRPTTDSIHLPDKSQFPEASHYYATALHELGHWTGHSSRLDRDLIHPFGSEGYAREELRAEIASMLLGDELGIGHDPGQHAAYVGSWIKALQDDPMEVFRAAADAEKIHQFVLSLEQQQTLEQSRTEAITKDYSQVLSADVNTVLHGPDFVFDSVSQYQGETLENALRQHGLNSISDITGVHPERFESTALTVLSPVFGLPSEDNLMSNVETQAHIERTCLALAFMYVAEELVMKQNLSESKSIPANIADEITVLNGIQSLQNTDIEATPVSPEKIWLDIPFKQKDVAKELAGTLPNGQKAIAWDKESSRWFARPGADLDRLKPWLANSSDRSDVESNQENMAIERIRLAVPYEQREAVKQLGGKLADGKNAVIWDKAEKCWFAEKGANLDKLKPWIAEDNMRQQGPAMPPQQEFADTLKSLGCIVTDSHPIMDGKTHRIRVEGDKKGEKAGFYVGHLDGHPAGYAKNNRTGIEITWKSKGYSFTPEEKARLQADAFEKLKAREMAHQEAQAAAALRVERRVEELLPAVSPTPYLATKGIKPQVGVLTDKEGLSTCIPATDANGKLWSMQFISQNGTKRFSKNSRKEGCFHALGGLDAIERAPAIVIAEGYATAASVSEALGFATIAAFDAGNLEPVARNLHEKFPNKPIIITGDDDRLLEATQGINPGLIKAQEAARAVNGTAVFPVFAPGEQARDPKGFTDFNDLATKSALGAEAVKRQVKSIVEDVFIINYSVVFSFVASLIFQRNNADARGWWPVLIIMSEFYAILFGLVFAVLALLLKTQHDKYTDRFAQILAISFISLTFLPFYFKVGATDHVHTSTIWMILLFSVHLLVCLGARLRKKL